MPPLYVGDKTCTKCGMTKDVSEFSRTSDGYLVSWCKPCRSQNAKFYRDKRLSKARAINNANGKKQRLLYPETEKARGVEWYQKNKPRAWEHRRKTRFGLVAGEFDRMLANQGGLCAICSVPFGTGVSPHIDHDHVTLKVRGLLCRMCNWGLGHFKDDPQLLRDAAKYLRKYKTP